MARRKRTTNQGTERFALFPFYVIALLFSADLFFSNSSPSTTPAIADRLIAIRSSRSAPLHPYRYIATACVLSRDASTQLPEFIVRNYLAGIDHFYIYGDDSDDDHAERSRLEAVLEQFARIVTYLPHGRLLPLDEEDPEAYVQMRVYRHCAETFGATTRWMAFIDSDEIFETDDLSSLQPQAEKRGTHAFLHDVLEAYRRFPVLCIRWRSVLTNGRVIPSQSTLLDAHPLSCTKIVNNTIKLSLRKTILQPHHLNFSKTPRLDVAIHKGFRFNYPYQKFHCIWGQGASLTPPIYLAHYWSRSVFEYLQKIVRGRPRANVPPRSLIDLIKREQVCIPDRNTSVDSDRVAVVRSLLDSFTVDPVPTLAPTAVQHFLSVLDDTEDQELCLDRIRNLLKKLSFGYTLSTVLYCNSVGESPACTKKSSMTSDFEWPFAWVEYLQDCNTVVDENDVFIPAVKESSA